MTTYQKFLKSGISLTAFGIMPVTDGDGFYPYFCTPKGASIIGRTGVDGVHYCFVRGFGETVFVVMPMNAPNEYVKPVAKCFSDFLSLLAACRDEALVADAGVISAQAFADRLKDISDPEVDAQIAQIENKLDILPMLEPQKYVHDLQNSFDYSKIRFTDDYYDIDMNPSAQEPQEWEVYFKGGFCSSSRFGKSRTHAGKEIQIGESFELDGKRWLIPSAYICREGIVIDMISQTEMSEFNEFYNRYRSEIEGAENLPDDKFDFIQSENPVITDVRTKLTVNGKNAKPKGMSGIIWIPEMESDSDCERIIKHYCLDSSKALNIQRMYFNWATKTKPRALSSLEIEISVCPKTIRGKEFCVNKAGQSFEIENPLTGVIHTLTINEFNKQKLGSAALMDNEYDIPENYISIDYTISPEINTESVRIHDICQSDSPKKWIKHDAGASYLPEAKNAVSIGIIGGADGPTAIILGNKSHQICSSLHFEPRDSVTLRADFIDSNQPSITKNLINKRTKI